LGKRKRKGDSTSSKDTQRLLGRGGGSGREKTSTKSMKVPAPMKSRWRKKGTKKGAIKSGGEGEINAKSTVGLSQ